MIRKPNLWDLYEDPYDNLMFAVLMQALADTEGFFDNKIYDDGQEALHYLKTSGAEIYMYLSSRKRKDGIQNEWNRIQIRSRKTGKIIGRR